MRRSKLIYLVFVLLVFQILPAFAREKQFNELFRLMDEFELEQREGAEIGYLCSFKVDSDGRIWIADFGWHSEQIPSTVRIHSSKGKLLKIIQRNDRFEYAQDVDFDLRKNAYVTDLDNQIVVFDSSGNFKYSFPTYDENSTWGIIPMSIEYDHRTGHLFIGGLEGSANRATIGHYLHKYTISGKLIGSFLPIDRKLSELSPADPTRVYLDLDRQGNIWIAQSMAYKVFNFSPDGKLIKKFSGKSRFYRPPYKIKGPAGRKAISAWRETWTEIANCLVTKEGLIIISLHTRKPTKYVVEIYSPAGKLLAGNIQTNRRLLGKDKDGFLYFVLDDKGKKPPREYKIGKFSLNLKQ